MKILSKIKQILINTFYPRHIKCICCGDEIRVKNVYDLCEECHKSLPFINYHFCIKCGLQFEKDGTGTCLNCKSNNFSFTTARSVATFQGNIVSVIHKLKYAKYKFLAEPLSFLLYDKLVTENWNIDLITYVPLHSNREKERGYNQSLELAKHLSSLTEKPIFKDIIRVRDTPTQTNLSRREREENVKDCFKVTNNSKIKDSNILLIDDVFTTGSTTNEISKELLKSGAKKIYVLTIAHAGFKQKI